MHVYGKVREDFKHPPQPLDWQVQRQRPNRMDQAKSDSYIANFGKLLDHVYPASQGIRVIDPKDKGADAEVIRSAREAINEAKQVYILGYGFDKNNSERLELGKLLDYESSNSKRVRFTNFRNINRVNKQASKIFFGTEGHFSIPGSDIERGGAWHYERSVRDVYEALELDFD